MTPEREAWGSRWGLILAAAGNAIGIGNLLRFPGQAANNGGGAFMIPYIVCLLIFGIPMMWVAWTIGRHGGKFGHGSLPGMFDRMGNSPLAKYVGVLGLTLPYCFVLYYTYIEAWCLGYAWFSLTGDYMTTPHRTVHLAAYYQEFLNMAPTSSYFPGLLAAGAFLAITVGLNMIVLYRGVAKGIELLAKIAMPLLFLFCILMSIRVLTLEGEGTALEGLNFLWTPDFSRLGDFSVWLAAAGQIFFTLSIGFGSLECYASYVREDEDIALSALTTAATNEFVEVIFGGMIAIPAAAVFFGADEIQRVASSGTFSIGMISMPEILRAFPATWLFGSVWFLLLFFAAFTSSVAVAQPVMAFFQDELRMSRPKATFWLTALWLLGSVPVILYYRYGVLGELDFWAGTLGLAVVALIEIVLFAWIYGLARGWGELQRGGLIQVPAFFKPIMLYVTPVALAVILAGWVYFDGYKGGVLTPRPTVALWVDTPGNFPGTIESVPPDKAEAEFATRFAQQARDRAAQAEADGKLHAEVQFGADGSIKVRKINGLGALANLADATAFERYLRGSGQRYEERAAPGKPHVAVDKVVPLILTVYYTSPYVWLARGIVIGSTILFLGLIAYAWKRYHARRTP
ncbi:MAG TPA: sodium-dependent transporter [Candidatus Xenobia bacterium]|nr:sodium-dependent transporter [Candidatus Xenobia bacterium]